MNNEYKTLGYCTYITNGFKNDFQLVRDSIANKPAIALYDLNFKMRHVLHDSPVIYITVSSY